MKRSDAAACELAAEVIRKFGSVRLRVQGTSMTPAIRPGDTIEVERTHPREIHAGEIVLFVRGERIFAHRVVQRTHSPRGIELVTQGDRMAKADAPISSRELLGRVSWIERGKKRLAPSAKMGSAERALRRVLRLSERATGLYLRLIPN